MKAHSLATQLTIVVSTVFLLILTGPVAFAEDAVDTDRSRLDQEMQLLKTQIERPGSSPVLLRRYDWLSNLISNCTSIGKLVRRYEPYDDFAPAANLCTSGALAVSDPTYNRVLTNSTGTGIGTGVVGNCSLSGSGTAVRYDVYNYNLFGCAAFPTVVTVSLCGPAGCTAPAALDSVLMIYRRVSSGNALTANGGLPLAFSPASACTNAVASNDDANVAPTSPGGSTCNQLNTSDCTAQCGVSTSLSQLKRSLGSGLFTIVVTGFGNSTVGNYNLYVDAPSSGCQIAASTTAAGASIAGRVLTADGKPIGKTLVQLTGANGVTRTTLTSPFGFYSFADLDVGQIYVVSAMDKQYTFAARSVLLTGAVDDADLVAEP